MAKPLDKVDKEPPNAVHQQAILAETIGKEERHQKLFTNYSINPFRKMHTLSGKPNSFHDSGDGEEDTSFKSVIERANTIPSQKYLSPQTEAQEIGWMTQPLLSDGEAKDIRFYHAVSHSEMSKYMEVVWAHSAQAAIKR